MIKLVASDLDGTLLLNGAQSLPEELFPLIKELKELGILFVAASGRQYANMKRMFAPVVDVWRSRMRKYSIRTAFRRNLSEKS